MNNDKESEIRFAGSNLLDDTLETRYGMLKHHPPEDIPQWFVDVITSLLTSHDAELARKIEGMRRENEQGSLDEGRFGFNQALDAVLALLNNK